MVAENVLQVVPTIFHILDGSHVCHRTAGGDVGQDDLLVAAGKDAGRFGHEVYAAENDKVSLGTGRRLLAEQEGIALEIGVFYDLFPLVVVTKHRNRFTQLATGVGDAVVQFGGGCRPDTRRGFFATAR